MLGTFWVWIRTAFVDGAGFPMYSNIVKCETMQTNFSVGQAKAITIRISEEQLLTPTDIEKADGGQVAGFIPAINDYVDIFYASGISGTDNSNNWVSIFSGTIVSQPFLPQQNSGIYEIQLIGNELFSNNKTLGNTIKDGANFINKNNKDIITQLLETQRNANITNAQYKIIFDNDIQNNLIQNKGGIRTNANQKVESVLKDILRANRLQLFITTQNDGEVQTIKYHITDKYYNPDYQKPFFTLNHYTCQILPRFNQLPVKQANRYYYNAGVQTTVDIASVKLENRAKIFYGETCFNLGGLAGVIHEEKIDNSFIDEENFNLIKQIRKGQASQSAENNIKNIANKLAFNKVKNDIIQQSVMQVRVLVESFEIPKALITSDGLSFWQKKPAIIDVGMRFILQLENFNYEQEMLITDISFALNEENLILNLGLVPVEILEADEKYFTLPTLIAKYKTENGNKEPTAFELIQYLYLNQSEPEAKFQLGLINPLQYGSRNKNVTIINQTRIFTM